MVRSFDRKLCLTAAALNCTTCKDLAVEFRRVNARTSFDVERAYKWLQGRALPRQRDVYADWLALLDLGRPLIWLEECDDGAFLGALCKRRGLQPELVLRRAEAFAGAGLRPSLGGDRYFCGTFVGYSHAWSPYYAGHLIRSTLAISSPLSRGRLVASYSERLPTARVHVEGTVTASGRSLYLHLREPGSGVPLFLSLFRAAPPASALLGFMCGATLIGHDPRPSVTRILFLRMPADGAPAERDNHYLGPDEPLSADLVAAGLGVPNNLDIDGPLRAFLRGGHGGGLDQILAEEAAEIASLFDRLAIARSEVQG